MSNLELAPTADVPTTRTKKATLGLPYAPPQGTLSPCPWCNQTVLTTIFHIEEQQWGNPDTGKTQRLKVGCWQTQAAGLNPVTGTLHDCELALIVARRNEVLHTDADAAARAHAASEAAVQAAREKENPSLRKDNT